MAHLEGKDGKGYTLKKIVDRQGRKSQSPL